VEYLTFDVPYETCTKKRVICTSHQPPMCGATVSCRSYQKRIVSNKINVSLFDLLGIDDNLCQLVICTDIGLCTRSGRWSYIDGLYQPNNIQKLCIVRSTFLRNNLHNVP